MKKILALLLLAVLLSSCTGGSPKLSDADMATRVSQMLTQMPATAGQQTPTATAAPTEAPTATTASATATTAPTATESPTEAPTAAETAAPTTGPTSQPTILVSGTPVTLTPTALPTIAITPLPTPTMPDTDPRFTLGPAAYTDTMDTGEGWPTGCDDLTCVEFKDGRMRLDALKDIAGWRLKWFKLYNAYLEMTVRPENCAANDNWGMIVRVPVLKEANKGYLYGISCEGKFSLRKWDGTVGENGQMSTLISWTANSAILVGPNQTNRLGMKMEGGHLSLYINGLMVAEANDISYTEGFYGVYISPKKTPRLAIQVDEMAYWNLP